MKSSTARKTKTNETPRLITNKELKELTLEVFLFREGWVVVDLNNDVKSVHRTQREAIDKGRAIARKRAGRLIVHGRNNVVRRREHYWTGPVRFEPFKPHPPSVRPVNATRKAILKAVKNAIRRAKAEGTQQIK
jgi:hypothetical protein